MTKLGLAFIFHGQPEWYFVLAEGIPAALKR